jgi:hypothetical protein
MERVYEVTHYAQRNYDTLEEWFSENIIGRQLYGNVGNETSLQTISSYSEATNTYIPFYN